MSQGEQGERPHYAVYFMATGELASVLYDSYEEAVADCELDDMYPVRVYGIPWPDEYEPEEEPEDQ